MAFPLDDNDCQFTWSNKRTRTGSILEKIDRVFINSKFQNIFPEPKVRYLPSLKPDHKPILWDLVLSMKKFTYPFRFHAMWLEDRSFDKLVHDKWSLLFNDELDIVLANNLFYVKSNAVVWNKKVFGYLDTNINKAWHLLTLASSCFGSDPTLKNRHIKAHVYFEYRYWHQL